MNTPIENCLLCKHHWIDWVTEQVRCNYHGICENGERTESMDMTRSEWDQYQEALKAGDDFAASEVVRRAEERKRVKNDAGKPMLTLVPRQIIWDICETRMYGLKKYPEAENWRKVEVERYRDAAFRHFMAYLDDPQGKDAESGIEHYKHLAFNVACICELEKENGQDREEEG